ncbi:MAG: DUF501 domain-containing protein [Ilumatobacteraceae bacterium]|jgi:hypothetical protein|nr:DUF501 domain-containing protein [Ilumatobacteraceae bacterium]MBJ7421651.1 DUF501 domain-containing protein [Ilumatobacteraceae bacterium]
MTKASDLDIARVTELLGRQPQGDFEVVLRDASGSPIVVKNEPLLFDGTPMPTRYWLVGPKEHMAVSRLESAGFIDLAESEVDAEELRLTHERYAAERDSAIPKDHTGPRPHGGVAGTRVGVKCLHAHYANWLVDKTDVVGQWVDRRLQQG